MIKQIDKIPDGDSRSDKYRKAQEAVIADIMQIMRDNIPLCEVTVEEYSENYKRDVIQHAINLAVWRYKKDTDLVIDRYKDFEVTTRKDEAGKKHYYIEYKKAVTDQNG